MTQSAPSPRPPAPLRVATWNMHKGVGTDRRRDLRRTAAVIAEITPDVMALQEADRRFGTRAGLLDLDHLHDLTGMRPLPTGLDGPSHGWHGNLILCRRARVTDHLSLALPGLEPRGALITDLHLEHGPLRVVAAHLGLVRASRRAQARAILDALERLPPLPTLLMGDLNEWRDGPGSPLRELALRFTLPAPVSSFPARRPFLPLDRMMATAEGRITDLSIHDTPLSRRASDHLPLTARLHLPGDGV
jgi:endonuclease/exonuclease/phosphatase family metal-dependent hydrolase